MDRQRATLACVCAVFVSGALACGANNSLEAAQTAVSTAQTALPGAQSTAQAGATLVSNAVTVAQPVVVALQGLLQGVSVDVQTSPPGAENTAVTDVTITGTDREGSLGRLEPSARQAAATGALTLVSQYYPNARVTLKVVDAGGSTLLAGSVAPGQSPTIQ